MLPRQLSAISCCFLLLVPPLFAFDTPLSDTAVREAYFLGQHHDAILGDFLQKYVVALPEPRTGPYIASVSFYTPFALMAINSSQNVNYSAQQAQLDHDNTSEIIRVVVQIWLTASYGEYVVHQANSRSGTPRGFQFRGADFWRQFRVRVLQRDQMVIPLNAHGEPFFTCGEDACDLTGATLTFEYPAAAFSEDTVTVQVTPPEGDPVSVDFDPTSLR